MQEWVREPFACAFICAGIAGMDICQAQSASTYQVNVTNTIFLARTLHSNGTPVIFLSSSAVFDGNAICPNEDVDYSYTTEYGKQKAATERALTSLGDDMKIVRLTKVLSVQTEICRKFRNNLRTGKNVEAFDDLMFSPISLQFVCDSLIQIASSKVHGVFHLSGDCEISYFTLAQMFADGIRGASREQVRSNSALDAKTPVLFRPLHPALGMARTRLECGIEPEPIQRFLSQFGISAKAAADGLVFHQTQATLSHPK